MARIRVKARFGFGLRLGFGLMLGLGLGLGFALRCGNFYNGREMERSETSSTFPCSSAILHSCVLVSKFHLFCPKVSAFSNVLLSTRLGCRVYIHGTPGSSNG